MRCIALLVHRKPPTVPVEGGPIADVVHDISLSPHSLRAQQLLRTNRLTAFFKTGSGPEHHGPRYNHLWDTCLFFYAGPNNAVLVITFGCHLDIPSSLPVSSLPKNYWLRRRTDCASIGRGSFSVSKNTNLGVFISISSLAL